MHPRVAKLVAYHDQELPRRRAERVAAHLARCASCRKEYDRIGATAVQFSAAFAEVRGFNPAAGLARLMFAADGRVRSAPPITAEMRRRVREELQIYFGAGTAAALADAAADDDQALLRRAESLFAAFLGGGCAARLIEGIVNGPRTGKLKAIAC